MIKRTYLLDEDVLVQMERLIPQGKRGAFVSAAIKHQLEQQRLEELRARIDEGLADKENEALYLEIERELSPASDELWRAIDDDL